MPVSFLAKSDYQSWLWRENYIATFLERDIPQSLSVNKRNAQSCYSSHDFRNTRQFRG